jgi:predicted nucleic acid-binding protein
VIYLDTSVALAHLLAEDRQPAASLWSQPLVSSRLLEYELWVRLNARGLARSHGEAVRRLLERVAIVEMLPNVLARAIEPFSAPVRTRDALHLATMAFVRERDALLALASYDERLLASAARTLGIPIVIV